MKTATLEVSPDTIELRRGTIRDLRAVWRRANPREKNQLSKPWPEYERAILSKTEWRVARDSSGELLGVIAWWVAPSAHLVLTGIPTVHLQRRPLTAVRAIRRFIRALFADPRIKGIVVEVDRRCREHCRLAALLGFRPVLENGHLVRCFQPHPLARFNPTNGL